LYSQIFFHLNHRSPKASDFLTILGNLYNKKYKIPEAEREKCKIRYYIWYKIFSHAIVLSMKEKTKESIEDINKISDRHIQPYEKMCSLNVLALNLCKQGLHSESAQHHETILQIFEEGEKGIIMEAIIVYNIVVEYLHVQDMNKVNFFIQKAYKLAEASKSHRNLIFSKILLLYKEISNKDNSKSIKSNITKKILKKKALEFVLRPSMEAYFAEQAKTAYDRDVDSEFINRGRQMGDPGSDNEFYSNKIISLGSKIKKKRSKTEHRPKKKRNLVSNITQPKKNSTQAAKKIWRAWKTYKLKKTKKILSTREKSAQVIQRFYRNYKSRKFFPNIKKILIKFQARIRSFLCTKKYKYTKRQIIKIQAYAKKIYQRKRYILIIHSITKVQGLFRLKKIVRILKRQQRAARLIQRHAKVFISKLFALKNVLFADFVTRSVFRYIFIALAHIKVPKSGKLPTIREEKSSTNSISTIDLLPILKIQSLIRMYLSKKTFKILKHSASSIQKVIRGYLVRKNLSKRNKAAKTLQKFLKSKLSTSSSYESA
jgi:IQ calmodulin-binding motif